MSKKLEQELREEAKKKGLTGEKADAFVYGIMRKQGWTPEREKSKKRKGK